MRRLEHTLLWFIAAAGTPLPAAAVAQDTPRSIEFRYHPPENARSVALVGSFNKWDRAAHPLTPDPDRFWWRTTLRLSPGIYQYLFVVDGRQWVREPDAPLIEDPNGNKNILMVVEPADYAKLAGKRGDGLITVSAVRHTPGRRDVVRRDAGRYTFTLRTRHDDVERVSLITPVGASVPLRRYKTDALYDLWRGTVTASGLLRYAFRLADGEVMMTYGPGGVFPGSLPVKWFEVSPRSLPLLQPPDWPRDSVFYQIFPDRFANGDRANDPPNVDHWGTKPTYRTRTGGDLAGVLQHMDYLADLGVSGLYFNPIFRSESNHGYDTTDYFQVDPRFGTNEELKRLVVEAHKRGWRVLLDGVFNHTSVEFKAFRDLREKGGSSSYRDWYFTKRFPLEVSPNQSTYVGWAGVHTMPKLRVDHPTVRKYLLDVASYWIRTAGIDGWRLDTADELTHSYWKTFRRTVKQAKPDAYVVGEIWHDAHEWLHGDELDSVMNYRWRQATLDFFARDKINPSELDRALEEIRGDYPESAAGVMFNILGSHDTPRLKNLCQGEGARIRQAVLMQMTYPGVPVIYYGDEIGMEGKNDPDVRRCMEWAPAKWDRGLHDFYRKIIALRRDHAALRRGAYRAFLADDKRSLFGFQRTVRGERVFALFNRSDAAQTALLPPSVRGLRLGYDGGATLTGKAGRLHVTLPPRGCTLLIETGH